MTETRKGAKTAAAPKKENLIPVYLPLKPDDNGVGEVDQRETITVNGVNRILLRGQINKVTRDEYEDMYNSGRFERL